QRAEGYGHRELSFGGWECSDQLLFSSFPRFLTAKRLVTQHLSRNAVMHQGTGSRISLRDSGMTSKIRPSLETAILGDSDGSLGSCDAC
ncbi:MAG: hypothetical protein ACHP7C_09050, partial [Lysobacterales bacterium]